MNNKFASYIRYSSKKQSEGYSIEYQSNANNRLITKLEGEFAGQYIDEAVSGFYTRISVREGMTKLQKDIQDGKVNCVVFFDESRLSRRIMDVFKEFYWPIINVNPDVRFYRSSDGTLWNPEDSDAKRNLIDAYKESAKKQAYAKNSQALLLDSKIRPGSRLPLGVHAILSDRIVPDENIAIVLFIFELASWGYSEQKIADFLTAMDFNLVLPQIKRSLKRDKADSETTLIEKPIKRWRHTTIHYILNNPIYIGKGTWNRRLSRNNSSPGPEEQIQLYGDFAPVIPVELWNLVHSELDRKRVMAINEIGEEVKKASIRMDTTFKLSGIVQCSKCKIKLLTKNSTKAGNKPTLQTRYGKPLCYYYCPKCNLRIDSNRLDDNILQKIKLQLSSLYNDQAISNKMKSWILSLDNKIKDLERELKEEEFLLLNDKSYETDLSQEQLDDYLELCRCNIQLVKWKIEDLRETRKKCNDLESSQALTTIAKRIKEISIDLLNVIEQRYIMFAALEMLTVKTDNHGGPIIDEIAFRGIPIPS